MTENVLLNKSKVFAIKAVDTYKLLTNDRKEFVMSKQFLRSATSIGANAKEGHCAQSKADFYSKMYIAYKEANETEYWLEILHETGYLTKEEFNDLYNSNKELIKILAATTKKQKEEKNKYTIKEKR